MLLLDENARETWLNAPWEVARELQKPAPPHTLKIVATAFRGIHNLSSLDEATVFFFMRGPKHDVGEEVADVKPHTYPLEFLPVVILSCFGP